MTQEQVNIAFAHFFGGKYRGKCRGKKSENNDNIINNQGVTTGDFATVKKQDKIFLTDTGLMNTLLNWKEEDVFLDADKSGKIFETYAYNQIAAQIKTNEEELALYHYRDREKREIDFIIEMEKEIFGIKVKSGTDIKLDTFKHLEWFEKNLAKNKIFTGIILYTGERTMQWKNGMYTVPINNLWE